MDHHPELERRLPSASRQMFAGVDRLHPGMQLYISQAGRTVLDAAIGDAAAGQPLTSDHRMAWLSAGKPLTAFAVLQSVDAGRLDLDAPVVRYLPEFGPHGKDDITIRHLLTHTAGIQPVPTGWPRQSWNQIIDRICAAKLRHGAVAGQTPAYDPVRSWFILGELLRRTRQGEFNSLLCDSVCQPLGMTSAGWLPIPAAVASAPESRLHRCDGDACRPEDESDPEIVVPSPGSSFRAPARELGRFYETLLVGGVWRGQRLLSAESVREMTTRQRVNQFDLTFQHPVDFGLGVILDSNHHGRETVPYGFGRHCSPETFGHGGAECAIAFADPRHQLVVALAANGRPGEAAHHIRHREICSAIYQDLGLA